MGKKGPKPSYYVCSSIIDLNLISKEIGSDTSEEAIKIFETNFKSKPQIILGPYFKKRANVLDNSRALLFTNQSFRAIYNEWEVLAIVLKEPENSAYLLFDKRVDNKNQQKPTGTFIVKIDELRIIKQ